MTIPEIEKLIEESTPGLWKLGKSHRSEVNKQRVTPIEAVSEACGTCLRSDGEWLIAHTFQHSTRESPLANARLIAAAPTLARELLSYKQREDRWIPCSESLPEEDETVEFSALELGSCDMELHPRRYLGVLYEASGILYAVPEDDGQEFSQPVGQIDNPGEGTVTHWRKLGPLPAPPTGAPHAHKEK